MKKLISLVLVLLMVVVVFAACTPQDNADQTEETTRPTEATADDMQTSEATDTADQDQPAEDDSYKSTKLYVGISIRSLTNPYQVTEIEGAQMFVDYLNSIGQEAELQTLVCDSSSEKQANDVKAFIAKSGGNAIIYLDPNDSAITPTIADICEDAGVYLVTVWSKPDDISPLDYNYWIAHHTPDNVKSGYDIAAAMFDSFDTPGEGKILAVQGMLGNTSASDRFKGLQMALEEYPNIELLAEQAGDWDTKKALGIVETWLSKYDDIDGIWCANDSMALGVVQALKNAGLDKTVKVVGVDGIDDAVNYVKTGEMVATVGSNGWLQAGYSLALAYDAWRGEINVPELAPEFREFNTKGLMISADTVAAYEDEYINNKPNFDFSKPFDMIYTGE